MTSSIRPLRSVLYLPGSKERVLEKAQSLPADALIIDLEDAVAPDQKVVARDLSCSIVNQKPFGKRSVAIRINGLDTDWGAEDLKAAAQTAADAILIPKVNSASDIHKIAETLDTFGSKAELWAMMETPIGILNAREIAASTQRLTTFIMGTNDLAKELGAHHVAGREPLVAALSQCLLAARAYGVSAVDGVYNAFKDDEGLRAECVQGGNLGFDGKTLIHPAQLDIANDVFAPDPEVVALAERYISAFEEAQARGEGVAVVDGKIVENLHVETAKKSLALAKAIASLASE